MFYVFFNNIAQKNIKLLEKKSDRKSAIEHSEFTKYAILQYLI